LDGKPPPYRALRRTASKAGDFEDGSDLFGMAAEEFEGQGSVASIHSGYGAASVSARPEERVRLVLTPDARTSALPHITTACRARDSAV